MKATVLKTFVDKHTKVIHRAGYELDLTCERFAEVNSTRRGMLVAEVAGRNDIKPATIDVQPEAVAPAQDASPAPSNDAQPVTVEQEQADTPPAAVDIKPEAVAPAQDASPAPSNDAQPGTVDLDQADTPSASEDIKPKTAEPEQPAKPEKKTRQTKKA